MALILRVSTGKSITVGDTLITVTYKSGYSMTLEVDGKDTVTIGPGQWTTVVPGVRLRVGIQGNGPRKESRLMIETDGKNVTLPKRVTK